ncbi:unnamed protein product [Timema podura]|uniref:Uncharacterized protein n=1 Tax=Timema podura TaxID=61482 RepID=A0ABN7PFS7_TIMPD|nr:unnamed protein product [Timema podura]
MERRERRKLVILVVVAELMDGKLFFSQRKIHLYMLHPVEDKTLSVEILVMNIYLSVQKFPVSANRWRLNGDNTMLGSNQLKVETLPRDNLTRELMQHINMVGTGKSDKKHIKGNIQTVASTMKLRIQFAPNTTATGQRDNSCPVKKIDHYHPSPRPLGFILLELISEECET